MTDDHDILTAQEAAELLRLNPYTVKQKALKGEIPGRKMGRGGSARWRFSRRQLIAWVEKEHE